MGICKNCVHFKKETIAFPELDLTYDTWINFANPEIEGAPAYDIATCDNPETDNTLIERDASTKYFFQTSKYTDTFGETTVAGENDTCPNFTPIP
jgi:hypothetical protein